MPTPFSQVPANAEPATAPPPVTDLSLASRVFGGNQIAALAAPLDASHVKTRSSYSYLPGWHVINEANRIFGFDGWHRETVQVQCVVDCERTIGRDSRPGWGVTYLARVRITIIRDGEKVIRDGSGAGSGIDADRGIAHESAIKEAETDAMKRALVTFGNPFGLALYDKEQRQVTSTDGTPGPADPFALQPAPYQLGRPLDGDGDIHPGWGPPPSQRQQPATQFPAIPSPFI